MGIIHSVKGMVKKEVICNRKNAEYKHDTFAYSFCQNNNIPTLSEKEVLQIDDYWGQFGVKFHDYSYHQMFYSVTGIHDPRFIPDNFAHMVIYPYYNRMDMRGAFSDKNLFYRILPEATFPERVGYRLNGRLFSSDGTCHGIALNMSFIDKMFSEIGGG